MSANPELALHPHLRHEIARLGGTFSTNGGPSDRYVDTPRGKRLVGAPLQALLSIAWPDGQVLVGAEFDEDEEISFPQLADGDPIAPDRALLVIGYNEMTQFYWVIDLDDDGLDDPMVHKVDHDYDSQDPGRVFDHPTRLSRLLSMLRPG